MPIRTAFAFVFAAALGLLAAAPAGAQEARTPSHCIAVADAAPGIRYLHKASWSEPAPEMSARIHYIGHSMFLIRSEDGLGIVTDYNGYLGPTGYRPDVATMNHAHSSHWSSDTAGIAHALPGWSEEFGEPIHHYLEIGDVLIRNVPTDIRGYGGVEENGNSIFVFEMAGLCIAHLGHLHHEPSDMQYAALGRVDVLMAPVDGSYTMNVATMARVVERLRSSLVIPMHWFSVARLESFLTDMSESFAIERGAGSEIVVSLRTLPSRPTVMVLEPSPLME